MSKGLIGTKFIFDYQPQRHWDEKVAFYFYGAGTASGLVFLVVVLRGLGAVDERAVLCGMGIGLILVLLALATLFDHLGPRSRWAFFYVFRNLRASTMSRGAVIDFVLAILLLMVLLPSTPGLGELPWREGTSGGVVLRAGVLVFALAFMAYSGLVLSLSNSIAFWNTPLLPVMYIAYSFMGGMAAFLIILLALGGEAGLASFTRVLVPWFLILLLASSFLLLLYVWGMSAGTLPSRESVRRLVRGEQRWSFWLGVVGVGLLAPMLVVGSIVAGGPASASALVLAAVAVQVGCFLLRTTVLRVGVYGYPV